jgi:hypothetical protein
LLANGLCDGFADFDPVAGRSMFTKLEEEREKKRDTTHLEKVFLGIFISEPLFPRVLPYSGAKLRCAKKQNKKRLKKTSK